jgi:hypothetical protein
MMRVYYPHMTILLRKRVAPDCDNPTESRLVTPGCHELVDNLGSYISSPQCILSSPPDRISELSQCLPDIDSWLVSMAQPLLIIPSSAALKISPYLDQLSDSSFQDRSSPLVHNTSENICLTPLLSGLSMEPQNTCESISASSSIHMASMYGQTKTVQLLLSLGADIHARDGDGRTALHLAVMSNNQSTVHLLLLQGANTYALDLFRHSALCYAAERGLDDLIIMLVQYGAPIQ